MCDIRCKYCGKECSNNISKSAHERFCKQNPDYENNLKNHIENVAKKGGKAIGLLKTENAKTDALNEIKEYSLVCQKCGNKYSLNLKVRDFEKGDYPKCCSSKCAHARNHSQETKDKITQSLKKQHKHVCPKCGKEFLFNGTNANTFCDECAKKFHTRRTKYPSTELHKACCCDCGKEIWCKTSDPVVRCYDCADEKHVRTCRQYDETGKLLFRKSVRQKISDAISQKVANGKWEGWKSRKIDSYPERFWKQVLSNNNIKYKFNYYVNKKNLGLNESSGYFLDFAIGDDIDLEIDGKQHKHEERKESDINRDFVLTMNGWKVYRVEWNSINTDEGKKLMQQKIGQFLNWLENQKKSN